MFAVLYLKFLPYQRLKAVVCILRDHHSTIPLNGEKNGCNVNVYWAKMS